MKSITLKITPQLLQLMNLRDEEVTEEKVVEAMDGLHKENVELTETAAKLTAAKEQAEKELSDLRTETTSNEVKSILDKGLQEGRFTAEVRKKLEKDYAGKPKDLADLVGNMPVYTGLAAALKAGDVPKDLMDGDWDTLDKSGKLPVLKEKYPDLFQAKYDAKFKKQS